MSGIKFAPAFGADPVAEIRFRVVANVKLQRLPLASFIANLLARCADWEQSAQSFDFGQSILQFRDQSFPLTFRGLSLADVADDDARPHFPLGIVKDHGGNFYREQTSVSAACRKFAVRFSGPSALFHKGREAGIRDVH